MTDYAPVSKKASKGCVFHTSASSTFFFKQGCVFTFHRTLGVPGSKNVRNIIQNAILGYNFQHHTYQSTPFRVMFCRCDAIYGCKCNIVEVSWYSGVFTRLSRWGPGFESHHRRGTFVLQQGNLSTLLLSTQVYKWEPSRRWQIIVFEFASAIIGCYTRQGMLPGEWKLCTVSAALKCIQWPG